MSTWYSTTVDAGSTSPRGPEYDPNKSCLAARMLPLAEIRRLLRNPSVRTTPACNHISDSTPGLRVPASVRSAQAPHGDLHPAVEAISPQWHGQRVCCPCPCTQRPLSTGHSPSQAHGWCMCGSCPWAQGHLPPLCTLCPQAPKSVASPGCGVLHAAVGSLSDRCPAAQYAGASQPA